MKSIPWDIKFTETTHTSIVRFVSLLDKSS